MIENSGESESSSKFNERSKGKIESLISAFNELGWNNQKEMTKDEMLHFLNTFAGNNKEFDATLAEKLFNVLDVDNTNKIVVEEFIKGYLQFENDLKKNQEEFSNKLQSEQINYNNLEEQCRLYKDEKLNSEGFCENSKISIEINNIEFKNKVENFGKIIIELIYNEQIENCELDFENSNIMEVNKNYEFKPKSKYDNFEIVMFKKNGNQISEIGRRAFPLNEITTQDECVVQIAIADANDENTVAALINAKIIFYWSDFKFYDEKRKKSEQKIKKLEDAINKSNKYLKELNEIYNKNNRKQNSGNNEIQWNNEIIKPKEEKNKSDYIDIDKNINNYDNRNNLNQSDLRNNYANNNVNDIKENFDSVNKELKGLKAIKLLGLGLLLFAVIGGIWRMDYPNQLAGILIFLACIEIKRNTSEKNGNNFKFLFYYNLLLILYDLIWAIIHTGLMYIDDYTGGHENWLVRFSMFTCFSSIVLKGFISVFLFKLYKYFGRAVNNSAGINY